MYNELSDWLANLLPCHVQFTFCLMRLPGFSGRKLQIRSHNSCGTDVPQGDWDAMLPYAHHSPAVFSCRMHTQVSATLPFLNMQTQSIELLRLVMYFRSLFVLHPFKACMCFIQYCFIHVCVF